jgi:uncharacterized protein (TIGR02266 family)
MTEATERRREERVPAGAAIRIRFKTARDLEEYYLRDISHGGMFIATQNLRSMGELLTLFVQLPEGDEIRLQARVVHLRRPDKVSPGMPAGMGVQFESVPQDTAERIKSCVETLKASRPPATAPRRPSMPPKTAAPPTSEDFELLRRLCWVLARSGLADRPLAEVLGVPGAAPDAARREVFRKLRAALGLDHPPAFLGNDDRIEIERKLRVIETIVTMVE